MIYFFQILLVIFYVVFAVKNSNDKKNKRTFKESKSKYQKMIDRANKAIEKSNKAEDFSNNYNLNKNIKSKLKDYKSKSESNKDSQKELKSELVNALNNRKTLLKTNENKLKNLGLLNEKNTKKIGSSKIIDQRSMENAVEHNDDSIYSHSIIEECEFDHSKKASVNENKINERKSKITNKALRDAVIMKEILDKPVSMR